MLLPSLDLSLYVRVKFLFFLLLRYEEILSGFLDLSFLFR